MFYAGYSLGHDHLTAVDLQEFCRRVPVFLGTLPLASLRTLLATSRHLRLLVHKSAESLRLLRPESHPEDVRVLAANSWPNLTKLELIDRNCQLAWMVAPCWSHLKHSDLAGSNLGVVGFQKLQSVLSPHLSSLCLSGTSQNTAAIKQPHGQCLRSSPCGTTS